MFKLLVTVTLAAATLVGPAVVTAQADTPGCVTRAEYRHVQRGFSKARVHHIFDTRGKFAYGSSGYGFTRDYKTCTKYGSVSVDYKVRDGVARVTGKYGFF